MSTSLLNKTPLSFHSSHFFNLKLKFIPKTKLPPPKLHLPSTCKSSLTPLNSSSLPSIKPYILDHYKPIVAGWLCSLVSVYSLSKSIPKVGTLSSSISKLSANQLRNEALVLGLFVVARLVATYWQHAFLWEAALGAVHDMRVNVFEKVLESDLSFFEGGSGVLAGDIAYRITAEANDVADTIYALCNENGKYVGFCSLGLSCQTTENVQLRDFFKMRPKMTGVLVDKINPLSDAYKILKKDDIILAFDCVPIANDGTVHFRNRERITFDHLVSMKKPNEKCLLRVLRDGKEQEFSITLRPLQPLVPVHQFDMQPSYYIFAGLIFVPLTQPYLHEYGEDWYNTSPRRLCERALRELPRKAGEQFVILSQVLMDDINAGYERFAELQIKKVNGVEIENLKHLCQEVENCSSENLRFDLDDDRVIVLNNEMAKIATSRILKLHRIPSAMSNDLRGEQNSEIEVACAS